MKAKRQYTGYSVNNVGSHEPTGKHTGPMSPGGVGLTRNPCQVAYTIKRKQATRPAECYRKPEGTGTCLQK